METVKEKESFSKIYGQKFQRKIDKLSDEQHEMVMNHIKKINSEILFTEKEDYYLFSSENISLEDLKKIWAYIEQF